MKKQGVSIFLMVLGGILGAIVILFTADTVINFDEIMRIAIQEATPSEAELLLQSKDAVFVFYIFLGIIFEILFGGLPLIFGILNYRKNSRTNKAYLASLEHYSAQHLEQQNNYCKCLKCYKDIKTSAAFCPHCGASTQ